MRPSGTAVVRDLLSNQWTQVRSLFLGLTRVVAVFDLFSLSPSLKLRRTSDVYGPVPSEEFAPFLQFRTPLKGSRPQCSFPPVCCVVGTSRRASTPMGRVLLSAPSLEKLGSFFCRRGTTQPVPRQDYTLQVEGLVPFFLGRFHRSGSTPTKPIRALPFP